ncbi:ABC transporter type 1, transmembrane domain [Sesbania bispinosa]|nr:ABC transporter type 1, transmembrane domain [Sesbania bispinosa]
MGERLLKRVREFLLEKVLPFEVGWFDQEENTSAAICARLETEANLVRSLDAERISLLVQISVTATLVFVLGLIVSWRVTIVMIGMQPLIIACLYSKSILMKSMSSKARSAQREGSQLAMEATINHRTITAFSSEKRMLNLFTTAMEGPKKESIKQSWISDTGSMTSDIAKSGRAMNSVFAILDRKKMPTGHLHLATGQVPNSGLNLINLNAFSFSYIYIIEKFNQPSTAFFLVREESKITRAMSKAYDPPTGYDIPYFRPTMDETVRGQVLSPSQDV